MPQEFYHTVMYSYVGDQHLCVFQDAPGFAGDHVPQVVVDPPTSSNPNFNHIPPGKSITSLLVSPQKTIEKQCSLPL